MAPLAPPLDPLLSGKGRKVPPEVLFGILFFEALVATLILAKACIRKHFDKLRRQ